jgi:hypothetical protein
MRCSWGIGIECEPGDALACGREHYSDLAGSTSRVAALERRELPRIRTRLDGIRDRQILTNRVCQNDRLGCTRGILGLVAEIHNQRRDHRERRLSRRHQFENLRTTRSVIRNCDDGVFRSGSGGGKSYFERALHRKPGDDRLGETLAAADQRKVSGVGPGDFYI